MDESKDVSRVLCAFLNICKVGCTREKVREIFCPLFSRILSLYHVYAWLYVINVKKTAVYTHC